LPFYNIALEKITRCRELSPQEVTTQVVIKDKFLPKGRKLAVKEMISEKQSRDLRPFKRVLKLQEKLM